MVEDSGYTIFDAFWTYAAEAPTYHIILEVLLVLWITYLLLFSKQYHPERDRKPTKKEEEELIEEWQPEPLVPNIYPTDRTVLTSPVVTGLAGARVTVDGKECLNFGTYNFLGLLDKKRIHDVAANSIRKYGVGSCGPRGFFGTVDVHLKLEEQLATFTKTEEAILYSYGFAAISSAIPAYSKRNDVIFCDEGVCFPIQKGLVASRSKVIYFKHNDMEDLEKLIEEQIQLDKKNPAKAKKMRKFIVAEGLYLNYGDLAPLPKMVEFRNKYRIPIILEESLSFGVLGETGRGAVEHFGLNPKDVDIICASMNMSMGTMGGFCAGKSFIVDHQRLSGLGYCFSASLPPLLASSAMEALTIMDESPELFQRVRDKSRQLREQLNDVEGMVVCGMESCPLIHMRLQESKGSLAEDQQLVESIVGECLANGLAVVSAKYLEQEERSQPPPSIRLAVCCEHTDQELTEAAAIIKAAAAKMIQ